MKKAIRINQQLDKLLSVLAQDQQIAFLLNLHEAVRQEFREQEVTVKLETILINNNSDKAQILDIQQYIQNPDISTHDKDHLIKKIEKCILQRIDAVVDVESLAESNFKTKVAINSKQEGEEPVDDSHIEISNHDRNSHFKTKRKRNSEGKGEQAGSKKYKSSSLDGQILLAAEAFQKKFQSSPSNTAKLQKIRRDLSKNQYGYLQYITRIKPDAGCENDEQKEAFGEQIKAKLMKSPYNLTPRRVDKNLRVIKRGYDFSGEKNLYKIKDKTVGYIVQPSLAGPGDVIIFGKTSCNVYERSRLLSSQNGFVSDDAETEPDLSDNKANDASSSQPEMQWIGNLPSAEELACSMSSIWNKENKKLKQMISQGKPKQLQINKAVSLRKR